MEPKTLTLEAFEDFLSDEKNSDLVSKEKYGVILVGTDDVISPIEITKDDFDKFSFGMKVEDNEYIKSHPTWPWVRSI